MWRASRAAIRSSTGYDIGSGRGYVPRVEALSSGFPLRLANIEIKTEIKNTTIGADELIDSYGVVRKVESSSSEVDPRLQTLQDRLPQRRTMTFPLQSRAPYGADDLAVVDFIGRYLKATLGTFDAYSANRKIETTIERAMEHQISDVAFRSHIVAPAFLEVNPGGVFGHIVSGDLLLASTKIKNPIIRNMEDFDRYLDSIPGREKTKKKFRDAVQRRLLFAERNHETIDRDFQFHIDLTAPDGVNIHLRFNLLFASQFFSNGTNGPTTIVPAGIFGMNWKGDHPYRTPGQVELSISVSPPSALPTNVDPEVMKSRIDGAYAVFYRLAAGNFSNANGR